MLQVTKNVTYCGESYVETSEGTHLTVATMTAVMSDNNLLNISKNITLGSIYDNFKEVIDADWEEFEEEIEEVMDNYIAGNPQEVIPGDTEPGPEDEDPDGEEPDDDGDGDDDTTVETPIAPGPVIEDGAEASDGASDGTADDEE